MTVPVGVVQLTGGRDPEQNARDLVEAIGALAARGARLVFTPEMSNIVERDGARLVAAARPEEADPVLAAVRAAAAAHGVGVALGSLALAGGDRRLRNRSLVIGPDGAILARYDKLHLFDVTLPGGERYRESATFAAGDEAVVADVPVPGGEALRLGLSICYDLRFPALYQALARAGAQVLAVPAAFTVPTGLAHWHVLLRARAIECGCWVVAAAQTGRHEDGRQTFGHSLVVSPWGEVRLDMGEERGAALADLDPGEVEEARARIPALAHARPFRAPAAGERLPARTPGTAARSSRLEGKGASGAGAPPPGAAGPAGLGLHSGGASPMGCPRVP